MRVFDDGFDMESYIDGRLSEIEGLGSRSVLKDISGKLFLELYKEIEGQYCGLEQRVLGEAPIPTEGPVVAFGIADRSAYDETDRFLLPMRPEDLTPRRIAAPELFEAIGRREAFFVYTVFLRADYLTARLFEGSGRSFGGTVKTGRAEYAARFHVRPNDSYRKQAQRLYDIFRVNYLPWRSVCAPYLYKLFDVYIDEVENWDGAEAPEEVLVDFAEFAPYVRCDQIPLWNILPIRIKTSTYPEPCVDKVNYEHRIFRQRFREGARYLVASGGADVSNIRWVDGDLLITCPKEDPAQWDLYEFHLPQAAKYPERLMDNDKKTSLPDRLAGQPLKTKLEVCRLLAAYSYERDLTFVDLRLVPNFSPKETYRTDDFILDEIRTGSWETALVMDFRPSDPDFYLNRDIMSFLVGVVQRHFPEYECCGCLV